MPEIGSLRLGFVIVNVRVEVPPEGIVFGTKSFEMTGGKTASRPAVA